MQASTQQDEDTSHSHQHLKNDTVTLPATPETEIFQPNFTQSSHIIESEEVIAVPQPNMATSNTNAVLPEKVMPETPQPPASSDISAMFRQLLSGQDSQADHNCGVKTAQDHQEGHNRDQLGHNQTFANFMGAQ
jgi:hypothetical protein